MKIVIELELPALDILDNLSILNRLVIQRELTEALATYARCLSLKYPTHVVESTLGGAEVLSISKVKEGYLHDCA